jgi:hypothetical protein
MGCNSSVPEDHDENENSKAINPNFTTSMDEDDRTLETLCVAWMEEFGTIKFPSLIGGKRLWYLDEFKPNGSREKIRMWKEAVVDFVDTSHDSVYLKLSPKNKVRERVVDLNTEWGRLALPAMNLSKEQRIKGVPLSDEQLQKAYALLSADYSYEEEKSKFSNANIEYDDEDSLSKSGFFDHGFSIGKEVDVQDVFLAKGRKEIKSKWRKAKIIDMTEDTIRVHYIGWDDRWDETIDLNRDGDRIKAGGTMTALFTSKSMKPTASFANKSDNAITRGETSMFGSEGGAPEIGRSKSSSNVGLVGSSSSAESSTSLADVAFRNRMKRSGMSIIEVEGDGNCLFRAVAHQLYLDPSRHIELRTACVEHMKKHRERFETFCTSKFDEHLRRMSNLGTWGDDLEIRAMEEILDRPFFIYCADNTKELVPVPMNTSYSEAEMPSEDEIIPVKLSYHGRSHYNSVLDQRSSLPLPPRRSCIILQSRVRIFEIEKQKKMLNPDSLNSLTSAAKNISATKLRRDFDGEEDEWTRSTEFSQ